MQLTDQILEMIKKHGVLVNRATAAQFVKIDHNKFEKEFVETGLIQPIYLKHTKRKRYSLFDVISLPEKLKVIQRHNKAHIKPPVKDVEQVMDSIYYQMGVR